MSPPYVLAIDQGTTGTRACVVGASGKLLAHSYRPHRQHYPREGWVEHDPREIEQNLRTVMAEAQLRAELTVAPVAVGLANQGETVLAWDRSTGEPLGNAIVWQDDRTRNACQILASNAHVAGLVRSKTGLLVDPYFSATKLAWILENDARARELRGKGRLVLGTLDAWLLHRLTGNAAVTDTSTAARTLLFDVHHRRYDDALLALFGVPRDTLPEVGPSVGSFGELRGLGALLDGAPLLVSLVDQPAALFGQGGLTAGATKATFGTGCFVYKNVGDRLAAVPDGILGTVAWERPEGVAYALDGGVLAAGSVVTWLRDALGLAATDAALEALAASTPDAAGVTCVPALAGLGAPHWKRGARAAWLGVGLDAGRGHLVRAAFEGIASRVAEVVRVMGTAPGIGSLRADGGLTASPTLMQLVADLCGTEVRVSSEPEATAMGVAYLALRASGVWTSDADVLGVQHTARVFEPSIGEAERASRLARFARARRLVEEWTP